MSAIIEVKHLNKELMTKTAQGVVATEILHDLNLTFERGEFCAITGPSGSGKSTLLYLLGGLDKPTTGDIFFDNEHISDYEEEDLVELRNEKVGFIYQFHFLLPEFSALENVMMPLLARGTMKRNDAEDWAYELLTQVGLEDKAESKPSELSGGQQQRIAIARALANKPLVIFGDEPTGNLDTKNSDTVYDLFRKINKELGQTIILVTHDIHFAQRADRIINIVDGRIESDVHLEKGQISDKS